MDRNGFKFDWMGVNLLPFVTESRLLKAVMNKESEFTDSEKRRNTTGDEQFIFNIEHMPNLALLLENASEENFEYELKNDAGFRLDTKLSYYKDVYQIDIDIPPPKQELKLNHITKNKVIVLKLSLPYSHSHQCSFLEGTKEMPKEVVQSDLMQGDRRTFMGETSIRVLERRLGIERDKTLKYQNSHRRDHFSSGYYNDSNVRGGYGQNPNSGIPYRRRAEQPTYRLGRQSQDQHKRVRTGEGQYDYRRPQTDPFASQFHGPPPQAPPMIYPPRPPMNYPDNRGYYDQRQMPMRDPNEVMNLRPPVPPQQPHTDRNDQGRQPPNSISDRRDRKSNNRFSGFEQ